MYPYVPDWIFKNTFAEKLGEKLAFFAQNTASLFKIEIITLVFNKYAIFFSPNILILTLAPISTKLKATSFRNTVTLCLHFSQTHWKVFWKVYLESIFGKFDLLCPLEEGCNTESTHLWDEPQIFQLFCRKAA
jgi:hypothetical protein